jgi:uncharacterized membrane protein
MWWIETTGYHLAGLIWLIVIAAIFVIALIALSTAVRAASSARRTSRIVHDHEVHHLVGGAATLAVVTPSPAPAVEDPPAAVVESEPPVIDPALGDSMRILHERYAGGEITREEYLQAREDMTG